MAATPGFSPPERVYPMGCVSDGRSLFLQGPTPVEMVEDAAFFRKTRAGRDHSTGSVDPLLRPPMEKRRKGPASDMPKNTRNLVVVGNVIMGLCQDRGIVKLGYAKRKLSETCFKEKLLRRGTVESSGLETLHDLYCVPFILSLFRQATKQIYIRAFDAPCVRRILGRRR
jgi:hypothetical protein